MGNQNDLIRYMVASMQIFRDINAYIFHKLRYSRAVVLKDELGLGSICILVTPGFYVSLSDVYIIVLDIDIIYLFSLEVSKVSTTMGSKSYHTKARLGFEIGFFNLSYTIVSVSL